MLRHSLLPVMLLAGSIALSSCGESSVPASSGTNTLSSNQRAGAAPTTSSVAFDSAVRPLSCYPEHGSPNTQQATVTFYGWPDNSPPGNAIAHPVIHQVASGSGTFCDPTTFATEPTKAENKLIPYGTRIYVQFLQQYFIREDDCTTSGPQGLGCKGLWFDLWIGGDKNSNFKAVINCENNLTPGKKVPVTINPPSNLPVNLPGPIYLDNPPPNGTCYGKHA